jgi:hypothetical protein
MRVLIYLLLWSSIGYLLWAWSRRQGMFTSSSDADNTLKSRNRFRGRKNPQEIWVQVYETASLEEARGLQARLQEDEIECVIYEQGKKDIHGNPSKGIGIVVPKTAVPHAQSIISRMPV